MSFFDKIEDVTIVNMSVVSTLSVVSRWQKICECTSHNFSLFVIFLSKIIKIGGNLTKL